MYVKGGLALYSPRAATPAMEPMAMPAIAPDESPSGEPPSTDPPVGIAGVPVTVAFSVDGPVVLDGPVLDGPGLDGPGLDGPGLDGPGLDRSGVVAFMLDVEFEGLMVVEFNCPPHGITASVKTKRQKRVEG